MKAKHAIILSVHQLRMSRRQACCSMTLFLFRVCSNSTGDSTTAQAEHSLGETMALNLHVMPAAVAANINNEPAERKTGQA